MGRAITIIDIQVLCFHYNYVALTNPSIWAIEFSAVPSSNETHSSTNREEHDLKCDRDCSRQLSPTYPNLCKDCPLRVVLHAISKAVRLGDYRLSIAMCSIDISRGDKF